MSQPVENVHIYNGKKLTELLRQLALMGGQVESLLSQTIHALQTRDIHKASKVATYKDQLATLHQDIRLQAEKHLSNDYFGAHDLRRIVMSIKTASDIERIGDISANICLRLKQPSCMSALGELQGLIQLGKQVQQSLTAAIDALTHENPSKAIQVYNGYHDINRLHDRLEADVISQMMVQTLAVNDGTDLISIIRYFERLADHAREISKTVYYTHMLEHLHTMTPDNTKARTSKTCAHQTNVQRAI